MSSSHARRRHRRLPSGDGRFAGLALVLLNFFGLAFVVYAAETTTAVPDQATAVPDA